MAYPTSLDSWTSKADGVDVVTAADFNSHSTAIVAIETELGTDPSGSFADVAARLNRLEAIGVDIYRASATNADTASGIRTMTGYDTTRRADAGFTVSLVAGTITVPSDGYYFVEAHSRFSAAYTAGLAGLAINDGTSDLIRGSRSQSSTGGFLDMSVAGNTPYITSGTVLRSQVDTAGSTSLVGSAGGTNYYFRVVRL